jgi:hypothetical protein
MALARAQAQALSFPTTREIFLWHPGIRSECVRLYPVAFAPLRCGAVKFVKADPTTQEQLISHL